MGLEGVTIRIAPLGCNPEDIGGGGGVAPLNNMELTSRKTLHLSALCPLSKCYSVQSLKWIFAYFLNVYFLAYPRTFVVASVLHP